MKKELFFIFGLVAIFSFALVLTAEAAAGTLDHPSSTPNLSYGGRIAAYDIKFLVASATPTITGTSLRLIFPSGFVLPSTVATTSITASIGQEGIIATSTVVGSDRIELGIGAEGANLAAGDEVNFLVIPGIQSPYAGGSFQVDIQITGTQGDVLESASSTAFTIIASPAGSSSPPAPSYGFLAPPSSRITTPAAQVTISAGTPYTLQGTALDQGVYKVDKVEISVNGGTTWLPAVVTSKGLSEYSWDYNWANPAAGSYTVQVRATDTGGKVETPATGVAVTVSAPTVAPAVPAQTTIQQLQVQVISLQQQVVALLQQLLQLLQSRF